MRKYDSKMRGGTYVWSIVRTETKYLLCILSWNGKQQPILLIRPLCVCTLVNLGIAKDHCQIFKCIVRSFCWDGTYVPFMYNVVPYSKFMF